MLNFYISLNKQKFRWFKIELFLLITFTYKLIPILIILFYFKKIKNIIEAITVINV